MNILSSYKRVVIKIGSALLVQDGVLRRPWLTRLCSDVADLKANGIEPIIVSSGAIALGSQTLGLNRAKLTLAQKQACAAVGQSVLTRAYEDGLQAFGLQTAQALLTLGDTEDRRRWLNATATLRTLIGLGIVPVVNENDTVATAEIRYGDNDRLAARTAQLVDSDLLILLSDIDGLYTADPRTDPSASHIATVERLDDTIMAMGGNANSDAAVGTGGMATKLLAAKICIQSGCDMIICDGFADNPLTRLADGGKHTLFKSSDDPKRARAQWIVGSLAPSGQIEVDKGAEKALKSGRSLLAVGITKAIGMFSKGDTVSILNSEKREIARGLSAYDSQDLAPLCGLSSENIDHPSGPVVVHRDNMVMI